MSSPQLTSCPHDVRPGTTVCLHCRHEARLAARTRRRSLLARVGIGAAGVAAVGAILVGGANVIQARLAPRTAEAERSRRPDTARADSMAAAYAVRQTGSGTAEPSAAGPGGPPRDESAARGDSSHNQSVAVSTQVTLRYASAGGPPAIEPTAVPRGAPVTPVLHEGRTDFDDGVYAERAGNTVLVHFDTPLTRTRRRDKLEHIVRVTLPKIYGAPLDSALAKIPVGALTNGRDPVTDLPSHGIWVPLPKGWAVAVWPQTRPGQDGPLVVTYKAVVMH